MADPADEPVPPSGSPWPLRIGFALVGIATGAIGLLPPDEKRLYGLIDAGAWITEVALLLAVPLTLLWLVRAWRAAAWTRRGEWLAALLLLALPLLLIERASTPVGMRVQMDEAEQMATAFALYRDHTPVDVDAALIGDQGRVTPLVVRAPKRGLLFPDLVAQLHRVAGYDLGNGLRLNAAAGVLVLFAFYLWARQWRLGGAAAGVGVLLAGLSPMTAAVTTSSGFEVVNLLALIGVSLALAAVHAERSALGVALLVAWAALLAGARYESLPLAALALAAAAGWTPAGASTPLRVLVAGSPLFLLPALWQRAVPFDHGVEQIGKTEVFSLSYVPEHLLDFGRLLAWRDANPPGLVLLLAAAAGVVVAVRALRGPDGRARLLAHGAYPAWLALAFGVILAYAWGDLTQPVTMRLALPVLLLLWLAAGAGVGALLERLHGAWRIAAGAVVVAAIGATGLPSLRGDPVGERMVLGPALDASLALARRLAPDCRPLFLTPFSAYYVLNGYSALPPEMAEQRPELVRSAAAKGDGGVLLVPEILRAWDGSALARSSPPAWLAARRVASGSAGAVSAVNLYLVAPRDGAPAAVTACAALAAAPEVAPAETRTPPAPVP